MSSQGDENLDNDTAQDLIHTVSPRLWQQAYDLMTHPHGHEYDDYEIGALFYTIEVILALSDKGLISGADVIYKIRDEIDPYLARWQAYEMENYGEVPEAREKSMRETFDQLRDLIKRFEEAPRWVRAEIDPDNMSETDKIMMDIFNTDES